MNVVKRLSDLRQARTALSGTLGLVPTMGYLHEGHLALVERAHAENNCVAVSIFVNPTQFGPTEDLATYPRAVERDLALLRQAQVDLVWTPEPPDVYPDGFQTWIDVTALTRMLEGAHRPGHFRGVATVVAKLFNIFTPDRGYFGQKDAQQVVVIQRMVRDLNIPVEIVVVPTVREADGLALSSRNARLSPAERAAAPVLYQALLAAQQAYQRGERSADALRAVMRQTLAAEPLARADYASVADPRTLQELVNVEDRALLSLAVHLGATRLIDNIQIGISFDSPARDT